MSERPEHRASLAVHCDCLHAALAAERVRQDRLAAILREVHDAMTGSAIDLEKLDALSYRIAADPEGGSPET